MPPKPTTGFNLPSRKKVFAEIQLATNVIVQYSGHVFYLF